MTAALRTPFLQPNGPMAAGSRPAPYSVPASGSGAPYCNRDAVGASPIARATAAQASCAATSNLGSRRTTIARATSVCRIRSSRACGVRSISRCTSHVAMVCSASRVAAAPVSSASGSIGFPLLNTAAVHPDDAGDHLPGPAQNAARHLHARQFLGVSVAPQGRFLPDSQGFRALGFSFRVSALRRQALGRCARTLCLRNLKYLPSHLSLISGPSVFAVKHVGVPRCRKNVPRARKNVPRAYA